MTEQPIEEAPAVAGAGVEEDPLIAVMAEAREALRDATEFSAQARLYAALAAAQGAFPPIPRDRTVRVQTKTGGSYTFSYAPLDTVLHAVRPALAANGLSITQLLDGSGDDSYLRTILCHSGGGELESVWPLRSSGTPQEFGSTLTYLRRYTLNALLGIASEEDDDGNHASGNTAQDAPKAARKPRAAKAEPAGPEGDPASPELIAQIREGSALLGTPEWEESAIVEAANRSFSRKVGKLEELRDAEAKQIVDAMTKLGAWA